MKKIFFFIGLLIAFTSKAQFPVSQSMGSGNTQVYSKGAFGSDSGYVFRVNFFDTTTANLGYLKNIPNIVIVAADSIWKRNNAATRWVNQGREGSGGGSVTPAPLTKTDDANVTLTLGGSPSTALLNATSLTLGWTGALSIARGGTNNGSLDVSSGNLFYGDGTKFISVAGQQNKNLRWNGSAYVWKDTTAFIRDRFGYFGEDNAAGEDRTFTYGTHSFVFDGTSGLVRMQGAAGSATSQSTVNGASVNHQVYTTGGKSSYVSMDSLQVSMGGIRNTVSSSNIQAQNFGNITMYGQNVASNINHYFELTPFGITMRSINNSSVGLPLSLTLERLPVSSSSTDSVLVKTSAGVVKTRAQSDISGGGGGSGVTTMGAVINNSNANAGTITGTTLQLNKINKDHPGVLTTGYDSIAGPKYFDSYATNFKEHMPMTFANRLPSQISTEIDDGKWNFFAGIAYAINGELISLHIDATKDGGGHTNLILNHSKDQGRTWTVGVGDTILRSPAGVDSCIGATGFTILNNGRAVIVYTMTDTTDGSTPKGLYVRYSDAYVEGSWSAKNLISTGSNTAYSVGGPPIQIGADSVLIIWAGLNGSTWTLNCNKAPATADSWGSAITMNTSTTSFLTETQGTHYGGGGIVVISRTESVGGYPVLLQSTDNGTTWANNGNCTMFSAGQGDMAAVSTITGISGEQVIEAIVVDKANKQINLYTGYADSIRQYGTAGFDVKSKVTLATTSGSAYYSNPVSVHFQNRPEGIVAYWKHNSSSNNSMIYQKINNKAYPLSLKVNSGIAAIPTTTTDTSKKLAVWNPTTGEIEKYTGSFPGGTSSPDLSTASLQHDTIPLFTFGGGGGNAGDTSAFTTSTIYGSFFQTGSDTLVITRMDIGLQGTSPDVTVTVYWNDSLNVTAGAVKLVNAGNNATNIYTGTSVTSFDNVKIPPGVWVWCKTTTVTTKPTYLTVSVAGYKIRKA